LSCRRGQAELPALPDGHLLEPSGRTPVPLGTGRPNAGPAVRGGQGPRDPGAFEDEQAPAPRSRQSQERPALGVVDGRRPDPVRRALLEERWYKNGLIYELSVRAFRDSNGDGIGDLPGLITRLDYLSNLGVSCIWLLPFYPSPWRDDGYDITDYYGVHPSFGNLGDFTRLVHEAGDRGIRVIIDLVL